MTMPRPAARTSNVRACELREADFDAWCALLGRSPQGGVYGRPEYLAALCEATGASYRIIGVFLDDQLVGGVPLYERRQRAGTVVANRFLLYYNSIVLDLPSRKFHSDQTAQMQSVLAALERSLADGGYAHVSLHNDASLTDLRPFLARGWQSSLSYTYVVSLTDMARQWERVDQNLKRLIRRCERDGVSYREDADFDALFRLHWQTHSRKNAPLYLPEAAFRQIFRTRAELRTGAPRSCSVSGQGHRFPADAGGAAPGQPHDLRWCGRGLPETGCERLPALACLPGTASRWVCGQRPDRRGAQSRHAVQESAWWRSDSDMVSCPDRLVAVPSPGNRAAHQDRAAAAPAPVARAGRCMNGAELICESLDELGVSHVFGLPGTQNVLLYEALRTCGLRSISASDEGAAAFMATGYAKASGRVGVLTTIPGPGFVYALAGVVEAQHDSIPLLWLTLRQADNTRAFQLQRIDQAAMAKPVVKRCMHVERADELARALHEAYAEALAGEPGPVLLEIASAVLEADCPRSESPARAAADAVDAGPLEALLIACTRPVIYAGQGAQGAADEVRRLAARLRAPVLFTSSGRGVLPDTDPLAFVQDFSTGLGSVVPELIDRADMVLALGCKFTHNGSGGGRLQLPANKLVRIDSSADVLAANYPARLAIRARVEDVLAQLAGAETPPQPLGRTRTGRVACPLEQ